VKRFYTAARTVPGGVIVLDDRPVRTPARHPLIVPSERLAEAIAAEWNAQGDRLDPRSMPLAGLANAAIDRVAPDREAFARGLAAYAESDLLCYRADGPPRLVERQKAEWDPIIAWARRRYDVDFELVAGVMHRPQPRATLDRLIHAVKERSAFELAALSPLVTIGGSVIVALALAEQAIDLDAAWSAGALEDLWQAEQWGADPDAARALDARHGDFAAAYRFLTLL
jgi:chaperone required for assembly of F1-ATPase